MGDAAPAEGLRQRRDLLAALARLAAGGRLGALAPVGLGPLGRGGRDRLARARVNSAFAPAKRGARKPGRIQRIAA
jgi:hypothetical protein